MQAGLGIPGVCPFAAYESASSWQETKHRHHAGKELDVIVVESGPPRVCWFRTAFRDRTEPETAGRIARRTVGRVSREEERTGVDSAGNRPGGFRRGGKGAGRRKPPRNHGARCAVARQQPRACPGSRSEEAANVPRGAVDPRVNLRRTATARAPLRAFRESATSTRRTATRQRPETRR